MNTSQATIKKDSLLLRMAADRQRLNAWHRPATTRDVIDPFDPITQRWAVTLGLLALSALRLPPVLRVPLRTAATISLRNRVAALFNAPPPAHTPPPAPPVDVAPPTRMVAPAAVGVPAATAAPPAPPGPHVTP